ncbi:hypothetical protein [Actinokineospora sp. NPDC004072]
MHERARAPGGAGLFGWWRRATAATLPSQETASLSAELQVMLVEYQALRDDERATANSQAALASVFVALLAGLFAILVGDCRFRAATRGEASCYELNQAVYVVAPALPFAVLTYIVMLGLQITLKSFYLRGIENEIRKQMTRELDAIPEVSVASGTELLLALTSPRRGRVGYRAMLIFLAVSFIIAMGGWMTFVVVELEGVVARVVLLAIYGPLLLLLVHEGIAGNHGGRTLLGGAARRLARSPEYPRLSRFAPDPARRTGRRTWPYLLLPRPADLVKWLFVPIAAVVGVLHGAADPATRVPLPWAVATWLVFEYLVYQARYQWNDIRGVGDDMAHPAAAARSRLPAGDRGPRAAVLISAVVALVRLALAAVFALVIAPPQVAHLLALAAAAVWALAAVYEWLRARRAGWALWLVVGGGYAIRTAVGLALMGLVPSGDGLRPFLAYVVAAWAFGVVFVTMTWVIEAVGHCFGVLPGGLVHPGQPLSGKPHLLRLLPLAGIRAGVGAANRPSAASQRPLDRRCPVLSPWNLALLVALAAGAAAAAPTVRASAWLALAVAVPAIAVVLPAGALARWLAAACVVLIAGGAGAWTLEPGGAVGLVVTVALFLAVYCGFRGLSYVDLTGFVPALRAVIAVIARLPVRALRFAARWAVGRRTWDLLAGREP